MRAADGIQEERGDNVAADPHRPIQQVPSNGRPVRRLGAKWEFKQAVEGNVRSKAQLPPDGLEDRLEHF